MTQRDTDLLTAWQTFRKEHGRAPANDNEFDEWLADLEVIRKCIERRE